MIHQQERAVLPAGSDNAIPIRRGGGDRLFTKDRLHSRLRAGNGLFRVSGRTGSDAYDVQSLPLEHFAKVRIHGGAGPLGESFPPSGVAAAAGDDFDPIVFPQGIQVCAVQTFHCLPDCGGGDRVSAADHPESDDSSSIIVFFVHRD